MARYDKLFSNSSQYRLELTVNQVSQSIPNNTSNVSWSLDVRKLSGSGYWANGTFNWSVNIGGVTRSGSKSGYDFRNYTLLNLGSGTVTITHNSDGKKTISSSGTWTAASTIGSATASGTMTLTTINRVPNAPTLSSQNITRNSFRINWSTNLVAKQVAYQIGGGSWVYLNASGTSGNFTVSGRPAGTAHSINVQVQSSASSLWSSSGNINITTLHVSTGTISVSPTFGYNNRLTATFTKTQTGGSTTLQYKLSTQSSWTITTASSVAITGLSPGTTYTVQMRLTNSSGEVNNYSASATTHSSPSGSFTLTDINKTGARVTVGTTSNTTRKRTRINGGSWITIPSDNIHTFSVSPGTTHSVEVELYSSTTGLTTILNRSITMRSNATGALTVTSRSRNSITIRSVFSDTITSYRWRINTGSYTTVNSTNTTVNITATSGMVSNTSYTLRVQALDSKSGQWGTERSINSSTLAFTPPTVSLTSTLTTIVATYSITDSCTFASTSEGDGPGTFHANNSTVTYTFTRPTPTTRFEANTIYSVTGHFIDQYGDGSKVNVTSSIRTKDISTISSFSSSPSTIDSLPTMNKPNLSINFSGVGASTYTKSISISAPGITHNLSPNSSATRRYEFSQAQINSMVENTTSGTQIPVSITVEYTDQGIVSPTKSTANLTLTLTGGIISLAPPTNIEYSAAGGLNLSALVSSAINQATINIPTQPVPLGSSIDSIWVSFQGVNYNPSDNKVTIGSVGSFSQGSEFRLHIRDGRGLTNSVPITAINTYEYVPPSLSFGQIVREGGFGEALVMEDATIRWSSPPTTSSAESGKNGLLGLHLSVVEVGGGSYEYGLVIPASNFTTTTTGAQTKVFESVLIPRKASTPIGVVFASNKSYYLSLSIIDKFGVSAEYLDYPIPTGQSIMFMDKINRQVGVNTTQPRGTFDVDGDSYITNVFSLNTLFFKEEDIEDL